MEQFSPGCALAWLALLAALVVGVVAIRRSLRRDRELARERREEIASQLRAQGLAVREDEPVPRELPRTPLVRRAGRRRGVHVEASGTTILVFDHEVAERPPLGRNVDTGGTSDDRTYSSRHTIACLRDPRLKLPAFELLPNAQGGMKDALRGAISEAGHEPGAEAAARFVGGMLEVASILHDRRRPLPLESHPQLAEAFRVFGREVGEIEAMLVEPVVDFLLEHPSSIVCGVGEWLLVSRRVGSARDGLPAGLLTAAETVELVAAARELAARLGAG